MIATAGGIDLWCASKLGEVRHHGLLQHAALMQVLDQCAVALVIHGCDEVTHPFDAGEGLAAVDVPGDLVEDGDEAVDRDEAHPALDQATRQQATLAEAVHAVALAHLHRLLTQVEGLAGIRAGHQAIRIGEVLVHQLGGLARFEVLHRAVHELTQRLATLQTHLTDLLRRQQIRHLEVLRARVRIQHERVIRLAQEARVLTMRHVATGRPHRLGQDHMRGHVATTAFEKLQRAAHVRGVDATGKKAARLHHLMARVMHGSACVIDTAH